MMLITCVKHVYRYMVDFGKKIYIFHMIDILLCRKIGIKVNNTYILFYITDLLGIYLYGPKDYL